MWSTHLHMEDDPPLRRYSGLPMSHASPETHTDPHHERRWLILAVLGIAQLMVVLDATIVMIDHDIHVMRDLVGRLYVLAAGQVIAEGPPSVLETDAAVRDVYTGAA